MKKRYTISLLTLALSAAMLLAGCSNSADKTPSGSQTEPPSTSQPANPEGSTAEGGDTATEDGQAKELMGLLGQSDEAVKAKMGEGSATTDDAGAVIVREYEMEVLGLQTITTVAYENEAANMIISYAAENEFDVWGDALTAQLGQSTGNNADNTEGGDSRELSWTVDGAIVSLKDAYGTLSLEIYPEG